MLHPPDSDLESSISSDRRQVLRKLLNEIEDLSELEKLYLVLKITCEVHNGPDSHPGNGGLLLTGGAGGTVEIMPWSGGISGASEDELGATPGYCSALHLTNQVEQTEAYTWILSHLDEDPNTCLRKDEVYDDYRNYCDALGKKPLNTADFGKVMKRAFPNVKPRRLGQRGQSKYCYGGMRKKVEVQPPSLPDISVDLGCAATGGGEYQRSGGPVQTTNIVSSVTGANTRTSGSCGGADSGRLSSNTSTNGADLPEAEMFEHCSALILEWAEKMVGAQSHGCQNLVQLAHFLVSQMYVNVRSRSAFYLVAEMQRAPNLAHFPTPKSFVVNNTLKPEPRTPTTPNSIQSGPVFSPANKTNIPSAPVNGTISAVQHHQARLQASPLTPTNLSGGGSQHFQHSPAPSSGSHAMSPYASHNLGSHTSQLSSPSSLTPSSATYVPPVSHIDIHPSPNPTYVQQPPPTSMRSPYEPLKQGNLYTKHSLEYISSAPGAYDPKFTYPSPQTPSVNNEPSILSPKRMRYQQNSTPGGQNLTSNTNTSLFCDSYMSMFSPAPVVEETDDIKNISQSGINRIADSSTPRRRFPYLLDISTSHAMPTERNNNNIMPSEISVATAGSDPTSRVSLVNRTNCANLNNSDSSADSSHTVKSFSRDELRTPGPDPYDDENVVSGSFTELPRLGLSPCPSKHELI